VTPLHEALRRAQEAAGGTPSDFGMVPWRFRGLDTERARVLARVHAEAVARERGAEVGRQVYEKSAEVPGWIVVTCQKGRTPEEHERYSERCRTAAQRFALSLWSEEVQAEWITGATLDEPVLAEMAGFDPATEAAVGILWYGHQG
jgi:nitroreductase